MKSELYELTEKEIEEFDNLFDGNTSEEEYYILKAKIQLDEILQHKYLLYKMLRREIEQDGLANKVLKRRLIMLDKSSTKKKQFTVLSGLFAVFIFIVFFIWMLNGNNKYKEIYTKFKDSESGLSIKMSKESKSDLNNAMINLANGKIDLAMQEFSELVQTDTTVYFIGYCNEKLNNDLEAISHYEKLLSSQSKTIQDKSVFRLSLLYIKTEDKRAWNTLQMAIKDSSNIYQQAAIEVLASLGK